MSRDDHNIEEDEGQPPGAAVLVVDDNPLILDVVRGLLRSQNYQVFTSKNGFEALDIIQSKQVDIIICDVMMPRMGGYELHDLVRQNPECTHVPFIFLTALDDRGEIAQGKGVGADDYLCKPFEPRELLAVVRGKIMRAQSIKAQSDKKYDNYRRRVIHTLSHEFRTPLVAINTGMELLMEHSKTLDPDKSKSLLDAVRRGGRRLEKLVSDFMVLQQMEAGVIKRVFDSRAARVAVPDLLYHYMQAKGCVYVDRGVKICVTDDSEGQCVKVVEPHIVDCIERVVSNAVKFSSVPSSSAVEVDIHAYVSQGEVSIDVKDRGIGLDPDKLDEAIDVFGQVNRERLEQQGGGLGLPIASRYAAVNQGRLEFEPRAGGGSIVSVVLPVAKEP
jgi:DNA-binding response OmpR family regulator